MNQSRKHSHSSEGCTVEVEMIMIHIALKHPMFTFQAAECTAHSSASELRFDVPVFGRDKWVQYFGKDHTAILYQEEHTDSVIVRHAHIFNCMP